jgi:DNA-binding IclR family transcriptional regulator
MVSAVSRAFSIVDALASREYGATASDIIAELGLEKSVVSRILNTLEKQGWIRDMGDGTYCLTLRLIALGLRQVENTDLYRLCYPKLFQVSEATGELVQLALVEDDGLTFVAKAEVQSRIRVVSLLGRRAALHGTAVGKVWLASLPEELAIKHALVAGLDALTPHTLTTVEQLRNELRNVRKSGYALNNEETSLGVRGLAAPIYDRGNCTVVGAITVVAPVFRMSIERAIDLAPLLIRAAEDLRGISYVRAFERQQTSPGEVEGSESNIRALGGGR